MNLRLFFFLVSAIIGSGVFVLPFSLGAISSLSIISFGITSVIVICLSYFFSKINSTSILIKNAFGKKISILFTYFYWIISVISTIVVVNEVVIYLSVFFPNCLNYSFLISLLLIIFFTLINCINNKSTTILEGIFTFIKISLLLIVPILILYNFSNVAKFDVAFNGSQFFKGISLSMWSFVGVETIPSLSSTKKGRTITSIVSVIIIAFLYLFNILVVFSRFGFNLSPSTYFDIEKAIGYPNFISFTILLICLGTLNSWINSSGFFAYQAAQSKMMPSIFSREYNKIPYAAIIISSLVLIPFTLFLKHGLGQIMIKFINYSCNGLFIYYGVICFAYSKENNSYFAAFIGFICICTSIFNFF